MKAGKVRYIGASNTLAWRLEKAKNISRANNWAEYCCVQQRFSYLRPKPGATFGLQISANDNLIDFCINKHDVTFLAYSPLLSGSYTRKDRPIPEQYQSPDAKARLGVLKQVAKEVRATLNQVVLAWMLQGTATIIPLIAASRKDHLKENIDSLKVILSPEQIELLTKTTG